MTTPGTTIGPYTIDREIGRGGMGVVLLATDTRLHRQVAIKALPPDLAADPDRLARFEREARVLASLSHPNIGAIHAVEHTEDGRQYLVLEYVPGETLAERLERGPLPVDEALHVASQIAAGVAAAHDAGVVHRDLKPANIKVTPDGAVKVLDFGIAKALASDLPSTVTSSPTLTVPQTHPGAVIGTTPYMSPEQARGKPIDKRTDVWSFGAILYECLTGGRAFPGDTTLDVLAAIVERDPDWRDLPANTPHRVRDLLQRCLAKDKSRRLRDIGDARIELDLARDNREWSTTSLAGQPVAGRRRRVPWGVLVVGMMVVAVVVLQVLGGRFGSEAPERERPIRFGIDPWEGAGGATAADGMIGVRPRVSRDGDAIAYTVGGVEGDRVCVRRLDSFESEVVRGTDRGHSPFFSPDGKWLGYLAPDNSIMKVPLGGGPAQTLRPGVWMIGTAPVWLADGSIVFTTEGGRKVSRLDARGDLETVLETDVAAGILGFERIADLPGGRGLIFSAWDGTTIESYRLFVLEAGQTEPRLLLSKAGHPSFVEPDLLVFLRDDTLMAVRLDVDRLEVVGTPVPVLGSVASDSWAGTAAYDLSPNGTLVYRPGARVGAGRHLAFVGTDGKVERITERPDVFFGAVSASPNGRYLTVATLRRRYEFWLYDLERDTISVLDDRGEFQRVAWSADGGSVTYSGYIPQEGYDQAATFTKTLGSAAMGERLGLPQGHWMVQCVAPDGRLVMGAPVEGESFRLFLYDPATSQVELMFETDGAVYSGELSPDGRWLAYYQYRSGGQDHLFVRAFPDDGRAWQLSFDDADDRPHWSPDGKTLYFPNDATMYAVDIQTEPEFRASPPREAFGWPFPESPRDWEQIDMHPSGKFVMIEPAEWERRPARFNVVLHFDEVVRRSLDGAQ